CLHGRDASASSGRERTRAVGRRRTPAHRRVVGFAIAAQRGGGRPCGVGRWTNSSSCGGQAGRRTEPAGAASYPESFGAARDHERGGRGTAEPVLSVLGEDERRRHHSGELL